MRTRLPLAAFALGLVLVVACASTPRSRKPEAARPPEKTPYDFKKEGQIPAPTEADRRDEPDVEEIPVTSSDIEVTEAEAPPDTLRKPPAPPDSTADGFRIQVFASADAEVAENARVVAGLRLGAPAYVDLDGGMYKVRVGNFLDRAQAEATLTTIRSHYYSDAWIVPAKVAVSRLRTP